MKNYNKTFKTIMLALIAVSVIVLLFGWIFGFETSGAAATDALIIWTYIMVAIAALIIIGFGGYIGAKNDPKFLKKIGIVVGGAIVIVALVYLISPGKPAVGMLEQPKEGALKLTDTMINLTYIAGAGAILSIIVGEVCRSIRDKKDAK
ncbi:MAG: hypothetical protein MJY43_02320 [Bacteroidales bacterium]|nr:hypothetical protein [Bacteroidales bacterium]